MYITRDLESSIISLSQQFPILLVTGPRQVGKTTMLKHLANQPGLSRTYVSLDDFEIRELANNSPKDFLRQYPGPLLIDEVQYAPNLFTYLKIEVDTHKQPGMYWLTGSQIFSLMSGVQESLAGRVALIDMSSCSQNELHNHFEPAPFSLNKENLETRHSILGTVDESTIFKRIFNGGMPALASRSVRTRSTFYASYIDTYIQRDVRNIINITDSFEFMRFFKAVALRTGQLLNIADIARDCRVSPNTAKSWLGILEQLGIIYYLHPYSNNLLTRTVKSPKLYMFDTGLVCFLAGMDSAESARKSPLAGSLYETYVISEIRRSFSNCVEPFIPYFYRDIDSREIDLVFESEGQSHPIEIKMTSRPDSRLLNVFKVLDRGYLPRGTGAIICSSPSIETPTTQSIVLSSNLI